MDIKRAYKFRFYPTLEQEDILARTFGSVRFVYNRFLSVRSNAWVMDKKNIGYHKTSAMLTELKKQTEFDWLNEISSVALQQSLRNLQVSFNNFFKKRSRYPKFKKKYAKQSVQYTKSGFRWDGEYIKLAKMDKPLKIKWSRKIPKAAKIISVTVSRDSVNRYFISILCDDVVSPKKKVKPQIGIDLGLTHFAILSTGEKINSHNSYRKNETKLAKLQRIMSRKKKGSKNRDKARLKVARIHAKISDSRNDFLHKLSTRLINENQVIAVEDLAIKNMKRNHCLAKSISDASWGEFIRQLIYKAEWYGRSLVKINRWFPSSKVCSNCGYIASSMPLRIREWTCVECKTKHDRDINAAKNILAAGQAVSALGGAVIPTTRSRVKGSLC